MNYYYAPSGSQQPDEHTLLCGYSKVRRYGTTQPPPAQFPASYINYVVQPNDTLQGIALKNDCSVSSIVRANKLWSLDDFHLKTSIRIPVCDSSNSGCSTRDQGRLSREVHKPLKINEDDSQESMKDILNRIDATIKSTTTTVKKLERESTLDEMDRFHDERRHSRPRQISLPKILHSDYYSKLS
ncbi:hypothetical protein KIN20_024859 [Parelaphostrongylus tenuis]|uniref:LysM domain-containing protein n=1 Tax=Parelaphostrongylus tenuis TaxID=148309 RepID=A0AAD5MU63_PARTN|nr:hypothetical protein KIN20_024859 [Parelaphostrongylus tenuis]